MTNDQEDLLLMVARIVLSRLQQRPGQTENTDPPDEYARECARLIDELRPYDQPASEAQQ